jgi:probable rRNA maturation factor
MNTCALRMKTRALAAIARRTLRMEGKPRADVSILLTDDEALRELNHRYRGFDKPTDVLSFSQQESMEGWPTPAAHAHLLGDVIISLDTAGRQARALRRSLQSEVELLTAHGVLHLLGYDDETEAGAEEMRRRERSILENPSG